MRNPTRFLTAGVVALLMAAGTAARHAAVQAQAPEVSVPGAQIPEPTFRVSVDLVSTDLLVRDSTGQFVADLTPGELEVYEDGVKQEIVSLSVIQGGRPYNAMSPPPPPVPEGIILPPSRPSSDTSGRIFLLFVDDLHLDFGSTPHTHELLRRMLKSLIHEGDMFGIVSTGTSSIAEQLTYDRQVLEAAITRIAGSALEPKEIIEGSQGPNGPTELRHRAHVAFSTAYELMTNVEKVQNRRKAVLYISSGYDFNPFETGRLEEQARRMHIESAELAGDPFYRNQQSSHMLAEADLVRELSELIRAANRANATFYTLDPRGLVAGPDIDEEVNTQDWHAHVREKQDSLRVLAEGTGGIAVVNQNDFDKALKRIDAETSDYYVLGYYSKNPDPLKRTRRIEVRSTRPGVRIVHRTEWSLRPTSAPPAR